MKFFLDNCISYRLANMVAVLKHDIHEVRHIREDKRFAHDTKDLDWIASLAADKLDWKILSGDANIIDTPNERAALLNSNLTFFCVDHFWMKMGIDEQAWRLLKLWPEIERQAGQPEPGLYVLRTGPGTRLKVEKIAPGHRARGGKFRDRP